MKKKILPLSLALCSVFAPLTAEAQTAEVQAFDMPIELEIGGYMTWYGAYANQNRTTQVGTSLLAPTLQTIGNYNNFDIMGSAEIYFSGKTELENGVEIGAMVQLKAGTDPDTSSHVVDETYMTIDSGMGRFIFGNVKNVTSQMTVSAPDASVLSLQDTDYTRMIVMPADFSVNMATYALIDDISTKVSYITPTFSDITLGFSVMPGNKKKGKDDKNLLIDTDGVKLFKYGLNAVAYYERNFGKFDVEASAFYAMYKPNLKANLSNFTTALINPNASEKNVNEYGGGLNVSMGNWSVGGSYNYTNMSRYTAIFFNPYETVAKGYSWDAGVMFVAGPFETSLNYFQSKANSLLVEGEKDTYNLYQLATKYKIISGVSAFVDIAYVEFDSASADKSRSNKGPVVAVGMDLSF